LVPVGLPELGSIFSLAEIQSVGAQLLDTARFFSAFEGGFIG
jgi:hypothetical protein